MALRIPWDKQETALLIDAYLRVRNKELSQQEAVKEVSTLLRRRAVLSGIEIDEVFRNENGISMQMRIIGGLVDEKPSGLHTPPKLFTEMVALCKTRRPDFDKILIQAKGECAMQVNVQEKFFAWLSARVPSEQLSEFYTVCRDIETFCMNKHILASPLFETTCFETLQHVMKTIRTNRIFQFKYFLRLGKMRRVMEYYLTFLRENQVSKIIEADILKENIASAKDAVTESSAVSASSNPAVREEVSTNSAAHTEVLDTNQKAVTEVEVIVDEVPVKVVPEQEDEVKKNHIACRRATANTTAAVPSTVSQIEISEKIINSSVAAVETPDIDSQVKERYTAILAENFLDGFRPSKAIDRNRFRMYYSNMFGQELTEEDEQLVRTLMKVGTLRDERIYVKEETEQKDFLEEINDTVMETFKAGASCIYLDCLFAKFQEQLAEMLQIYNVDSLESVLFSSGKRNYFKRYSYLCEYSKEPAPARDVVEYMKNSHLPVTYSEIKNGLWYIPLDKIKHTLTTTPGIVNVASEAYLYAPNLPVSEREIQQIAELIRHALLQRSYISDVELLQLLEEHCPSVLMNTPNYPMWGLRNALAYLLRESFSFRGAIISNKDEEISMSEVFSDFCQRSEHITVDELKDFASELSTVIYWDSVYNEMVRINQKEFVRRGQIHFDIEQTDAVLDGLIRGAYAPIKTIDLFLLFPAVEVPWNHFVLESYAANYSKKFRLLHVNYAAADCCGAVVRQESDITDYRTLIIDVLAKNTGWKDKKDALQLLVDLGYQQRRSYSDIEKVMQEARARGNGIVSEQKK